eukprot:g44737.t1
MGTLSGPIAFLELTPRKTDLTSAVETEGTGVAGVASACNLGGRTRCCDLIFRDVDGERSGRETMRSEFGPRLLQSPRGWVVAVRLLVLDGPGRQWCESFTPEGRIRTPQGQMAVGSGFGTWFWASSWVLREAIGFALVLPAQLRTPGHLKDPQT